METMNSLPRPGAPEIAATACELWLQDGAPDGMDLHYWLRAERQLGMEYSLQYFVTVSGKAEPAQVQAVPPERKTMVNPRSIRRVRCAMNLVD